MSYYTLRKIPRTNLQILKNITVWGTISDIGLLQSPRMALMEKKRYRGRRVRRHPKYRRRRTGLFVFIGLAILTLGAFIFFGADLTSSNGGVEQVAEPPVAEAPPAAPEKSSDEKQSSDKEQASDEEQTSDEQQASKEEEEPAPIPPNDPTMYLSIPKLGISGATVVGGEGGLEIGAQAVSGAPWLPGSNTYIAGHRLGFPGTGSDHIFFNLPSLAPGDQITLTDSLGQTYRYRVSEILQVDPYNLSVLSPVGKDVISLQTCIENYGDFATLGPNWNVRYIVRGERV